MENALAHKSKPDDDDDDGVAVDITTFTWMPWSADVALLNFFTPNMTAILFFCR